VDSKTILHFYNTCKDKNKKRKKRKGQGKPCRDKAKHADGDIEENTHTCQLCALFI